MHFTKRAENVTHRLHIMRDILKISGSLNMACVSRRGKKGDGARGAGGEQGSFFKMAASSAICYQLDHGEK